MMSTSAGSFSGASRHAQNATHHGFLGRINDPLRQWKLSPMDWTLYQHWYDYSRARDMMLKATDTDHAPWHIVRSDDKRRARLNCISRMLALIPYKKTSRPKVKLPKRSTKDTTTTRPRCGGGISYPGNSDV